MRWLTDNKWTEWLIKQNGGNQVTGETENHIHGTVRPLPERRIPVPQQSSTEEGVEQDEPDEDPEASKDGVAKVEKALKTPWGWLTEMESSRLGRVGGWKSRGGGSAWDWGRAEGLAGTSGDRNEELAGFRRGGKVNTGAGRNQRRFRNTGNHLPNPVDQIHIKDVHKFLNIQVHLKIRVSWKRSIFFWHSF